MSDKNIKHNMLKRVWGCISNEIALFLSLKYSNEVEGLQAFEAPDVL